MPAPKGLRGVVPQPISRDIASFKPMFSAQYLSYKTSILRMRGVLIKDVLAFAISGIACRILRSFFSGKHIFMCFAILIVIVG